MKNSFHLFYRICAICVSIVNANACVFVQYNRLEVQLNAVVSRFPLELTFPVGLRAYSIFENIMGEPKAQLVHGEFHRHLLL